MVRAGRYPEAGLKKGPWSLEEDEKLVSYIQRYGHGNWRALPKQAGLSRCGKSCRLRWLNYLRPDIKRGNLTKEEEEAIIAFHGQLGNRWSAIAARLPGRTDNEIKNVWHTHLKKRMTPSPASSEPKKSPGDATAVSGAAESLGGSFNEVSSTVRMMNSETKDTWVIDENSSSLDEFLEGIENSRDSLPMFTAHPPVDDHMDFWRNVLMEGGESSRT
ncbi:unnamed protein product [Spirodela intermedia]|uniref:Uncharacterized protein n=1 Tax=Spirodela intermedia TaxID=51605 RepID=A0A7I8L0Z7_SPIIN|nr:unnamed protein product [Spirodela intermedia]